MPVKNYQFPSFTIYTQFINSLFTNSQNNINFPIAKNISKQKRGQKRALKYEQIVNSK